MADLEAALADALGHGQEAGSLDEVFDAFGDTRRGQNSAIAAALAGTSDKRSREYRSAMRRVQRWRTTGAQRRRPSSASRRQLTMAAPRRAPQRLRTQGARVRLRARIRISEDARQRPPIEVQMTPDQLEPVLDAWERDDMQLAADAFIGGFAEAWGLGEPLAHDGISDVSELEIQ